MRQCSICKKSSVGGGTRKLLRGHYNPTAYGKKRANLQWIKIPNKPGRFLACTRCIKTSTKKNLTRAVVPAR